MLQPSAVSVSNLGSKLVEIKAALMSNFILASESSADLPKLWSLKPGSNLHELGSYEALILLFQWLWVGFFCVNFWCVFRFVLFPSVWEAKLEIFLNLFFFFWKMEFLFFCIFCGFPQILLILERHASVDTYIHLVAVHFLSVRSILERVLDFLLFKQFFWKCDTSSVSTCSFHGNCLTSSDLCTR